MAAQEFNAYVRAMDKASLLAQREFAQLWAKLETTDPYAIRDALLALVPGIVIKYSDIAATAALEYYETERAAVRSDDFQADMSDGVPLEQIEASIRYAAGHLFKDDADGIQPERYGSLFDGQDR